MGKPNEPQELDTRARAREEALELFAASALDFPALIGSLERFAHSSLGKRSLRELAPLGDAEARAALTRVREMDGLRVGGDLPAFAGVTDVPAALREVRRAGRSFEEGGIVHLRAFLLASERLSDWMERVRAVAPQIARLNEGMPDFSALRELVDRIVDGRGQVRSDASEQLKNLRREEEQLEKRIDKALKALLNRPEIVRVLSDTNVHLRGGRRVLAVKAKSSGRVAGLVHDRSQSEQTVFIEPKEAIEAGNRLAECRADMRREISRLLLELTRSVLDAQPALELASERIAWLELAVIGAQIAEEVEGRVALIPDHPDRAGYAAQQGDDGAAAGLLLRTARHPLLLEEKRQGRLDDVVPIDLRLGEDFDMLIITGPNTGGKTLALKTAGLFALMTRVGLPVCCARGTTVPLYDGIIADIGDEQEISQSLSTFSSHMVRIREGLRRSTPNTLFLLDELGAGTDPDEGAALGEAILEDLLGRRVPTIASTHLGKLKEFAYRHARAENACVEFDAESLAPCYHVLVGTPGESGALIIAERLGMPKAIVGRSKERLERRDEELLELMADVRDARTEAERARSQAESRLEDASRAKQEIALKQAELERRGELLEAEAQRGLEERVRDARRRVERARTILGQLPESPRAAMTEALDAIEADLATASLTDRRAAFLETLSKGKLVYLPRHRKRCIIHKVDRNRREVTVNLGAMKLKVDFDEVTWYEAL